MYDLVSGVNVAETRCLLVGARPAGDFGSSMMPMMMPMMMEIGKRF